MDLRDAIRGTGAVRAFTDSAVDDATVAAILDDARFAPSGGNRQGWRVVVVSDLAIRRRLGEMMQRVWNEYRAADNADTAPFSVFDLDGAVSPLSNPRDAATAAHVPNPLLEAIDTIPVMLVVAVDLRRVAMMDRELDRPPVTGGASIYPFCWNVVLAARARGLGGVITTFLSRTEREAASLLGLPATHALAATIFLGHPVHQPTRLRRAEVATFTTRDRFDGPPIDVVAP